MRGNKAGVVFKYLMFVLTAFPVMSEAVITSWGGDAMILYETGFTSMVMKHPGGGVCLFNRDLVQNDAPGSGHSEKGVYSDIIWGKNRARKMFLLDNPSAYKAWLMAFISHQGKFPLKFTVNGNPGALNNWNPEQAHEMYRWTEFPIEWLKKGKNVVELFCPEATNEGEGWEIDLARADEFEAGGGNPADVGKTSFKSIDTGESWKESPFGPLGQTRAEYSLRISLNRYVRTGWLAGPVIDLWRGDSDSFIVPQRELRTLKLAISSDVPENTRIEYYLRKGTEPGPFSQAWEEYQLIGEGPSVDCVIDGKSLNRRYIQIKMTLASSDPLKSPVVKTVRVIAELNEPTPLPENIVVMEAVNPPLKYSSLDWEWEQWDRPEFRILREQENLDELVAGSRTQFDAQVKLFDYARKRWRWTQPFPEYPGWDALSIVQRINKAGGGGMCIQFNNFLAGLCMAFGWQARLVNIVGHEVCEVWNDEFGKWIYLDAAGANHYLYDPKTATPLNILELHMLHLDYYYADRSIDWLTDIIQPRDPIAGKPVPVLSGSRTYHRDLDLTGFESAIFMRMIPRNNWYEKPYPRPLMHGVGDWPWNGYINWYDDRTPPMPQYSRYTDRARDLYPDLNRVHVDATSSIGTDRLFLFFETYTPNFSHFEVNPDEKGWIQTKDRWTWYLQSGENTLQVRVVTKLGVKGKPSRFVIHHADVPFNQ
jgi:hypothetical protein